MSLDKLLDRIEDKLEEYEDNIDDDVPPWYGSKDEESGTESNGDTKTTKKGDSFQLAKSEDEISIYIEVPDVPQDDIEIRGNKEKLVIEIEGGNDYEYELPEDADAGSVNADYKEYNDGLLEINIDRN